MCLILKVKMKGLADRCGGKQEVREHAKVSVLRHWEGGVAFN